MCIGITIKPKQRLVRFSFQLESLSSHILGLHINPPVMKLEDGHIAISINWYIVRIWRHKWIAHNAVKVAFNLFWNFAMDDEVGHFSFEPAWCSSSSEIKSHWPFGLEAVCPVIGFAVGLCGRICLGWRRAVSRKFCCYRLYNGGTHLDEFEVRMNMAEVADLEHYSTVVEIEPGSLERVVAE